MCFEICLASYRHTVIKAENSNAASSLAVVCCFVCLFVSPPHACFGFVFACHLSFSNREMDIVFQRKKYFFCCPFEKDLHS